MTHLREFGTNVWVLLQGQNVQRKILPKSKRRAYVGYNDEPKSVIYYNADTRRCLTSRTYAFLTPYPAGEKEDIIIYDNPTREGEREEEPKDAQENNAETTHAEKESQVEVQNKKRKRTYQDEPVDKPRKTRGVRPDYRLLDDPYSSEEEDDTPQILTAESGDEFHSLKEARNSDDWPEWQKAIETELQQLRDKGTWELTEKPVDAIPLSNKWVFV